MIYLEYIIAQCQVANNSVAIKSHKNKNQNPSLKISQETNLFLWELTGLNVGTVENIDPTEPRATRLDFYIGMNDLEEQIDMFPYTLAPPSKLQNGLRIPIGTERAGGKKIRWIGPLYRLKIIDIKMSILPFKLLRNHNKDIILNIDREHSMYPIESKLGRTIRQIHFGIEHEFKIIIDNRIKIPRICFQISNQQYSSILEALKLAIKIHKSF